MLELIPSCVRSVSRVFNTIAHMTETAVFLSTFRRSKIIYPRYEQLDRG